MTAPRFASTARKPSRMEVRVPLSFVTSGTMWPVSTSIALNAAETIRKNTLPIWALETTNDVAVEIRDTVRAIEAKGGALAGALQGVGAHVKR